ncbi:hypothetical protein G6F42_026500 [Rhizopus arrhizus]|nr:hypothetical protein G6F42_026500 [Rhizopus arrhizus]
MVLQYKGFDGLWKCLLNRDDSLKRVLKQSLKNHTMLQMRVPREQDLLSSGYTDKRLLALTTRPTLIDPNAQTVASPTAAAAVAATSPAPANATVNTTPAANNNTSPPPPPLSSDENKSQ